MHGLVKFHVQEFTNVFSVVISQKKKVRNKMSRPKYWVSSCGRIELPLFKEEYMTIPCSGAADDAVSSLYNQSNIICRFDKYSDDLLSSIVKSYGDYNEADINNRTENIRFILWMACCDLQEGK
jgi:hypothetical protein